MTSAIICRGGSARKTWPSARGEYRTVYAVNCAASVFACDVVVALDPGTYRMLDLVHPLPSAAVYWSGLAQRGEQRVPDVPPGVALLDWAEVGRALTPGGCGPLSYSMEVAIILAARHSLRIDIFGMDWGTDYGPPLISPRRPPDGGEHPSRWGDERARLLRLADSLAQQGVTIRRILCA